MRHAPETAVIVLNYNGIGCLPTTLRTLLRSAYRDFEVILVDNASTDGSMARVRNAFAKEITAGRIRIIQNAQNEGFAEGNNIGYRAVRNTTRYVALLNYDNQVPTDWLGKLVATMHEYPHAGIVGSTVADAKNKARARRTVMEHAECTVTLNMELAGPAPRHLFRKNLFFHLYVSGNGMMVRKSAFPTLFNPDYFAYAEDIDLCWNARLRGLEVILRKDALLYHLGSIAKRTDKRINEIATFNGTKNQVINYIAHYSVWNIIRIFPLFAMTQFAQLVHDPRKILYKLKAYFWTVAHFRRVLKYRRRIQRQRKIADRQIIETLSGIIHNPTIFPPGIARSALVAVNKLSVLYCRIVRLPVMEAQR